jgi:hypothetical protein
MSGQTLQVDLTRADTTAQFPIGTAHITDKGYTYKYLQADGAVTKDLLYTIDENGQILDPLTTTIAASGKVFPLCISPVTLADNEYCWCFVGPGQVTLNTAAATAANAKIYTTATGGKVDDDSSGTVLIPGLVAPTAIGSATTGTFMATTRLYVSN